VKESLNALVVFTDGLLEVLNRHLVIGHVLVDEPTLNIHGLVFGQLLHNSSELIECLLKLASAPEHESLVEHRRNKGLIALESLTELADGLRD
jgi:hypothetical protein